MKNCIINMMDNRNVLSTTKYYLKVSLEDAHRGKKTASRLSTFDAVVRVWNGPRACGNTGINRNPPDLSVGRFNRIVNHIPEHIEIPESLHGGFMD